MIMRFLICSSSLDRRTKDSDLSNRIIFNTKIYFYPRINLVFMTINTEHILLLAILLHLGTCFSLEGDWTLRTTEITLLSAIKKPIRLQFDKEPSGVDQQITGYLTITACNILTYNFEVQDSQIFLTFISLGRSTRKCEPGELVFVRTQLDQTFYFYIQYNVMILKPPNAIAPIKLDRVISNSPPSINGVWVITDAVSLDKINDPLILINGSEIQLCRGQNSFTYKISNYPDITLTRKLNASCNDELTTKLETISVYKFNPTTTRETISFYDQNGTVILELTNQQSYLAERSIIFDKITANTGIKKDQLRGAAFWNTVNGIEAPNVANTTVNIPVNTTVNITTNITTAINTNITTNLTSNITVKNSNATNNSSNNSGTSSNITATITPLPTINNTNTSITSTIVQTGNSTKTNIISLTNSTTTNPPINSTTSNNSPNVTTTLSSNNTNNQTISNINNTATTANKTSSTSNITNTTTVPNNQSSASSQPITPSNASAIINSNQPKSNNTNASSTSKNASQTVSAVANVTSNSIEKPVFALVNAASDIFDVWYPYNTDQIPGLSALPLSNTYQVLINAQRVVLAGGCNTLFSRYSFSSGKFNNLSVNSGSNTCPNSQDPLLQGIIFNYNNSYYFASTTNPKQKLINILSDKGVLLLQLTTTTPKASVTGK